MSKRSDLLVACLLGNRWRASTTAAGATATAVSPTPSDSQSKPHLETLFYSIRNFSGAGGVAHTTTIQVRAGSETGTVMAAIDHLVPASTVVNVAATEMGIPGKRGQKIVVMNSTVVASVQVAVNAAGWIEDTNG